MGTGCCLSGDFSAVFRVVRTVVIPGGSGVVESCRVAV